MMKGVIMKNSTVRFRIASMLRSFAWLSLFSAVTASGALTSRLTFDDIGAGGVNALHADPGVNAVVKNRPAVEVGGLGSCYVVPLDDPAMADESLKYGSRAVAVPRNTFISIPHGLAARRDTPFCIVMRSYCPLSADVAVPNYNSLYSFSLSNTGDGFAFVRPDGGVGGGGGSWKQGYRPIGVSNVRTEFYNGWHTWILSQGESGTELYFDGTLVNTGKMMDLTGMPYVYVACDNDGEDWLTYFDYIEIYDESKPAAVFGPVVETESAWEGAVTRSAAPVTRDEAEGRILYTFSADATFIPSYAVIGDLLCYDAQGELRDTIPGISLEAGATYAIIIGRYTKIRFRCNPPPRIAPDGNAELAELGASYAEFAFSLKTPGDGQVSAGLWFGCAPGSSDPAVEKVADTLREGDAWRRTISGLTPGETYSYLFISSNATDTAFVKRGSFSVPQLILSSQPSLTAVKLFRPGMLGGISIGGHSDQVNVPAMTSGPEGALANNTAPFREGVALTLPNTTYAYRTKIYMEAGRNLHFAGCFYDWTDVVFNNETVQWGAGVPGQGFATIGKTGDLSVPLDGWYDLRVRLGTTGGNIGAMWSYVSASDRTPLSPGFGYNIDGAISQNSEDYTYPEDAGDGEFMRIDAEGELFSIESLDIVDGELRIAIALAEPLDHDLRITVCCGDTDYGSRVASWPAADVQDGGVIPAGATAATIAVPHKRTAPGYIRIRAVAADGTPWAKRQVAWSDQIGYSPDVSMAEPALAVRRAALSRTRDGATVEYSLYWPGAGHAGADVYVAYGSSPDSLTETNLVAESVIGSGSLVLTGFPSGETVFISLFARNAAGLESPLTPVVSLFMPTASTLTPEISGFASRRHVEITADITELGAGEYTSLLLMGRKLGEEAATVVASREVSEPGEYTLVWEGSRDNAEWGTNYVFYVAASNYSASAGMAWVRETLTKTLELSDSGLYTWKVAEGDWTDPSSWSPVDPTADNAGFPIGSYADGVFTNGTKAVVRVSGDQSFRELILTEGNLDITFTGNGKLRALSNIVVGEGSRAEFDGVSAEIGTLDFRVDRNSDLFVRNGAVVKAGKFHFPIEGYGRGTVSVLNGAELQASNYVEVDGGMTLLISNALVRCGDKFWFGDRAVGGKVILAGETPRLEVAQRIQGAGLVSPCEMIFRVPARGYRNVPVVAGEIDAGSATYTVVATRGDSGYSGPKVQPLLSVRSGIPLESVPLSFLEWPGAEFLFNEEADCSGEWTSASNWPAETAPKVVGFRAKRGFLLMLQ